MAIFNLQGFSFTCVLSFLMPKAIAYVVAMVTVVVSTCMCKLTRLCVLPSQNTYGSALYIGMDEVSQHHCHTFEKSNLNFQFFNLNSVLLPQNGSYGQPICVSKIMVIIAPLTTEI